MNGDKVELLEMLLLQVIQRQVGSDVMEWLQSKGKLIRENNNAADLNVSFAAVPRKTGRTFVSLSAGELSQVVQMKKGFSIEHWPIDKLCRLWLLMQVNPKDETVYVSRIENLFRDAEMNELTALYSALPVFAYPESWRFRATEGIRSNIGTVLESIMYENPYPSEYLSEASWNQLVLKAFFTDKDVNRIIGLDERANKSLSSILLDYAHERQAAQRSVNPQLWRLVSKFIDEYSITDIEKLLENGGIQEKHAAVLACFYSNFEPAKRLLEKEPVVYASVKSGQLNWDTL